MDAVHYTLLFVLITPGFCTCGVDSREPQPGGVGLEERADSDIQALCDLVKSDFKKSSGLNVANFEAVSYISQVVAGMIYFVKVDIGGNKYCHLKIFKPLPYTNEQPSLMGFQVGKTKEEAIAYF